MTRLPNPGGDNGTWGNVLNSFLEVSLNSDGTLQTSAITKAGGLTTQSSGAANGIATLDGSGQIPASQLGNLSANVNFRGAWQTNTNYNVDNAVSYNGGFFICATSHNSGAAFSGTNWTQLSPQTSAIPTVFNVMGFGATGNGVSDDSTAINNAIAAAQAAGGGVVFFPAGTYATGSSITITGDSILLRGSGWDTVIEPKSGANFDVIATAIPSTAGTSGYVRNYIGIEQLSINCTNMSGTTAGQGNGIHWYGVRYSYIRDVFIQGCPNWAILLDGDNTGPGNNFGYDNQISRCVFDVGNANIFATNCEANDIIENRFKWAGAATAAAQPAFSPQDTTAMHLRCGSGYMNVSGNIFGKGGTYSTEAIRLSNSGPCRVVGNRFDQVRNQAITINGGNHIFADNQLGSPSTNTVQFGIQIGSSNNTIIGNKFDNTAAPVHYSYAIGESGGPFTNNTILGNNLLAGTSGYISLNSGSVDFLGYNPGFSGVTTTTSSYSALPTDTDILCNQSAAITITIPNPANMASRVLVIKDISGTAATNNITITPSSGTIDGASSKVLITNYDVVQLVTDGTNWYSLNATPPVTPLAIYDGEIAQTSSSAAGAVNTAYLVAVTVPAPVTLTGVRVRFASGGAGHYDVGIYKSDGTNGGPKTLLAHAAATATSLATSSSTLTPAFTSGNINIDKGVYWLALWIDNTTDTFNKQSASGNMSVIMSGTTSGPLPSNATTLTGLANANLKPILIGIRSGGWS
ncbi:MAG TPA: glycosyl hydrolase family 28-related protein [Candidatus Saccharimonadales bacterium]|nr:glycosyl hydrolase family 28-related protein [Candidatus Saccharimonadales bacterium]